MLIAMTGATGFLGRYLVARLAGHGHQLRLWCRKGSDRSGFDPYESQLEWVDGSLGDAAAAARLVQSADAIVHAALDRPGPGFRGMEGELLPFLQRNFIGTIQLIEEARAAQVGRFVFISTCAVHEQILDDRPLDESHPLRALSHYGASKGAIEQFVHSYGLGLKYSICALRPTGIFGVAHPISRSKWYPLVRDVVAGKNVTCVSGGKEVHASDVAAAVDILLSAPDIAGQCYACYDHYVSEFEVAMLAKTFSQSSADVQGNLCQPRHQIVTDKIEQLGMRFGGQPLLEQTIHALVKHAQQTL